MEKLALISNHLVLTEAECGTCSYPVPGVILIESGLIRDIILFENESVDELMRKYGDWNPVDYSEFYISPGVIDLNTRVEWESLSQLTFESAKGGCTSIVLEPGHFLQLKDYSNLYCDVFQSQIVNETTNFTSLAPYTKALKAYLCPPSPTVKSVCNLEHVVKSAQMTGLPLFIDPSLPDPRMLYMASPLRLENIDQRGKSEIQSDSTIFAAAFPERTDIDSDSDSGSDTAVKVNKTVSLQVSDMCGMKRHRRWNSNEKFYASIGPVREGEGAKQGYDIYQALDIKIRQQQNSIEDLCRAEKNTYCLSGATSYRSADPPKKSSSLPSIIFPESPDKEDRPIRKRRPAPIQIKANPKPDVSRDYNYYLANYPDHWETTGIEKVLECMSINTRVHFYNLSSATAVNCIRKAKKKFKNLTCEVSSTVLSFTSNAVAQGDTRFKNSPPIRNQGNLTLLWDMLKMKCIDCLVSAHSFIDPSLKMSGVFAQTLSGIPAAGCTLAAVWTKLHGMSSTKEQAEHYILRLAKWLSMHPAMVIGAEKEMGKIEVGKRADLVVWKPYEKFVWNGGNYARTSPFVGMEMMGKVYRVYLRGNIAYESGRQGYPVGSMLI